MSGFQQKIFPDNAYSSFTDRKCFVVKIAGNSFLFQVYHADIVDIDDNRMIDPYKQPWCNHGFKPLEYFGYHQRGTVIKIYLTIITVADYLNDIFFITGTAALAGFKSKFFHTDIVFFIGR